MPTLTAAARPQSALKGVALVSVAVFVFAAGDALSKVLVQTWAVPMVLAVRYALNAALLLAVFAPRQRGALFRVRRPFLVGLRAAVMLASSVFFGLALQRMPVGETVAIVYLAPFLVMILSVPLLGERVGGRGWVAAAGGFLGVLLVTQPGTGGAGLDGTGLDGAGVVFALLSALTTVAYHLLTRRLVDTETTAAMLVWTALAGTVVFGATLPWTLGGPMPDLHHLLAFAGLGLAATLGHFLFTAAYREAPASYLAPFNYLHIVWAAGFGWIIFGHAPTWVTTAGMALVVLAGGFAASRRAPDQASSSTQTGT